MDRPRTGRSSPAGWRARCSSRRDAMVSRWPGSIRPGSSARSSVVVERSPAIAPPPERLLTERLLLRRWQADDAERLMPVLEANVEHLAPWIPWSVAEPLPLPRLAERLARFQASFDEGREWLYAIYRRDDET